MVYFRENPYSNGIITRGTPIFGNPHLWNLLPPKNVGFPVLGTFNQFSWDFPQEAVVDRNSLLALQAWICACNSDFL